jgi:hypothetical protein
MADQNGEVSVDITDMARFDKSIHVKFPVVYYEKLLVHAFLFFCGLFRLSQHCSISSATSIFSRLAKGK